MTGEPGTGTGRAAGRPAGASRLVLLIAAVAAIGVLAGAVTTILSRPDRQVATGIVVAVQATSLSDIQGFSIRTTDGRTIDFTVGTIENATTFAPGHLAEHKASLVPIRVTYLDAAGSHVAVRLEDAP